MLRFEVGELGAAPLPALDVAVPAVIVGSGAGAHVRLPAQVAREVHLRIEGGRWVAIGEVVVNGARRAAGEGDAIGSGTLFELGSYRVRVAPSPGGTAESSPQRTESLARELVRSMLGTDSAPVLEIESGPMAGRTRALPPPEARVVVGRGDEADWVILDEELSRTHAEIRRGWDGTTIRDLESKNGTRVNGAALADATVELHDGATISLGDVVIRFRDPAERHMNGEPSVAPTAPAPQVSTPASSPTIVSKRSSPLPFYAALIIAGVAVGAIAWLLAT